MSVDRPAPPEVPPVAADEEGRRRAARVIDDLAQALAGLERTRRAQTLPTRKEK